MSDWMERNVRALGETIRAFGKSAGTRAIEHDGVFAEINPKVPERSVFNGVIYSDKDALAAAYDEIAEAYAGAGCAWTVWTPDDDAETAKLLESRGHVLDAAPRAMGIELGDFAEPDLSGIDWTGDGHIETMCSLNDQAYDFKPGTWSRGVGPNVEGLRIYVARLDGEPAATVATRDTSEGDCSVWCVATTPQARGKGLSTALMRQALRDGAERGCPISTLQATKLGTPVYKRIGYEDFGAIQMWELRG